jgi:hypothetical protein
MAAEQSQLRCDPFAFQFAERNVNRPLILAAGVKTIEGKIARFADAHAGVTKQQENIAAEIIAAQQFFLKRLILQWSQSARKPLWNARNVLVTEEMSLAQATFRSKPIRGKCRAEGRAY